MRQNGQEIMDEFYLDYFTHTEIIKYVFSLKPGQKQTEGVPSLTRPHTLGSIVFDLLLLLLLIEFESTHSFIRTEMSQLSLSSNHQLSFALVKSSVLSKNLNLLEFWVQWMRLCTVYRTISRRM